MNPINPPINNTGITSSKYIGVIFAEDDTMILRSSEISPPKNKTNLVVNSHKNYYKKFLYLIALQIRGSDVDI